MIALILILSGGDDEDTTADTTTTPTAVAQSPSETGAAEQPASEAPATEQGPASPAAESTRRTATCPPLLGSGSANSGQTYDVTSSATDGDPAGCAEARSVLLSALNGGGTTIGDWSCTTQPGGPAIATCTSVGGRKIQARG